MACVFKNVFFSKRFFECDRCVFVLVVSLESESSKQSSVRYWLEHFRMSSPKASVVIVATHADVLDSKVLSAQEKKLRDLMPMCVMSCVFDACWLNLFFVVVAGLGSFGAWWW